MNHERATRALGGAAFTASVFVACLFGTSFVALSHESAPRARPRAAPPGPGGHPIRAGTAVAGCASAHSTSSAPSSAPVGSVVPAGATAAPRPRPEDDASGRLALRDDLERALAATVSVRWERGRAFSPRTIGIDRAAPREGTPSAVARAILAAVLEALGDPQRVLAEGTVPPPTGRAFVASNVVEDEGGAIVSLDAFAEGLPIRGGALRVELRRSASRWAPERIVGRFHLSAILEGPVSPAVEASLRERYAPRVERDFTVRPAWRLVAHEVEPGRLRRAFEVETAPAAGDARREVLDAETGALLVSGPAGCSGTARVRTWPRDPSSPREAVPLRDLYVWSGARRAVTAADGSFALPGPVSLEQGFAGPRVRVFSYRHDPELFYEGPDVFTLLDRESDARSRHQDEASAFVTINAYNAYMRATHPAVERAASVRLAVLVKARFENAYFTPAPLLGGFEHFPGFIELGAVGGRSLARDASIVEHEYTHALLRGLAYLYGSDEALGINEGLADYFPCARAEVPLIGRWSHAPHLRALDGRSRRLVWGRDASPTSEPHTIGSVLGQALWRARAATEKTRPGGRLLVDRSVFGSVLRLPPTPTLLDAREAVLSADRALASGAHRGAFEAAFAEHGIVAPRGTDETADDEDEPEEVASKAVAFQAPRKRSHVVHLDERVEVAIEASSASGAKVVLAATPLARSRLESKAGPRATGRLVYEPTLEDRGRHVVVLRATAGGATATRVLTFIVRKRRT